jgi:hypothetical protein
VSASDFLFALDLSDEPHFDRMLRDLAAVVLRTVGFDAAAIDTVTRDVQAALAAGADATNTRCDVRFRAGDGTLWISVAFAGGRTWETAHALPARS